jgi:hypothetical protein
MSHLGLMILFAACVATIFGTIMREKPREQIRFGGRVLGGLVAGAYVLGWLMYWGFR